MGARPSSSGSGLATCCVWVTEHGPDGAQGPHLPLRVSLGPRARPASGQLPPPGGTGVRKETVGPPVCQDPASTVHGGAGDSTRPFGVGTEAHHTASRQKSGGWSIQASCLPWTIPTWTPLTAPGGCLTLLLRSRGTPPSPAGQGRSGSRVGPLVPRGWGSASWDEGWYSWPRVLVHLPL